MHADAKYKVFKEHPSNEDFYQVLAAGRVNDIETVALVYPSHGAEIRTKCYRPFGTGRPHTVFTITIGLEAFATGREIRLLREKLRTIVALWLSAKP